ncbi:MAG: hypothetical protein MJ188_09570, partial [Treponema sp.]|nr:hypothetical protein [Treponema sp.]
KMKKLLNIAAVLVASLVLFASCSVGDINPEVALDVKKFENGYGNTAEADSTFKANDDGSVTIAAEGGYTQAALKADFTGAKSVTIVYNATGKLTFGFIAKGGARWDGRVAGADKYVEGTGKDDIISIPVPAGVDYVTVGANGDATAKITIKEVLIIK